MNNKENQEFFAELGEVRHEGYEVRIIKQARELEAILNDPTLGNSELDELDIQQIEKESIAAMDAECPYLYQKVVVTGNVIRSVYDQFTEEYSLDDSTRYEKKVVTAAGFATLIVHDSQGTSRHSVGHLFITEALEPVSLGHQLVDFVPRLYSFAPVGSVDILADLPDANNIDLLANNAPELLSSVERAIFDAENECDALRRLKVVRVYDNHDFPKETLVAMLSFIEERLEMDKTAPYIVSVQGITQQTDDGSYSYYRARTDLIGYHTGLRIASYPYISDGMLRHKEYGELMVELNVIDQSKNQPLREMIVPVRNIRKMYSMRDAYTSNTAN